MATIMRLGIPSDEIASFCRRWRVQEMSLFGSVLDDRFQEESDVDILVQFVPGVLYTLGQLDQMQEDLEAILGRPVDLIDKLAVQESPNYIRRREIMGSAQVIYAEG